MFKRMSIAGNQPATFPDENSMVVWLSEDGPIKINLETGAKGGRASGSRQNARRDELRLLRRMLSAWTA